LGEYQPKYKWRVTWPDQEDAGSQQTDFSGWDVDIYIGRIRLEPHGLKKGQWQWSGGGPNGVRERLLRHQGFAPTAREASRMVENYYERLMRHNGLIAGKDDG
jgi:hypothetical protein